MKEHGGFSPETIQKSVEQYITVLTEEMALTDETFRENITCLVGPPQAGDPEAYRAIAGKPKHIPPFLMNIYTNVLPRQGRSVIPAIRPRPAEQIAKDEIPAPAALPHGSRPPAFPPNPLFVGREDELRRLAAWLKGRQPGRHRASRRRQRHGRHRQEPVGRRVRPPLRPATSPAASSG